jgi:hypothetical protein
MYMSAGESLNWAATGANTNGGVRTTGTTTVCLAVTSTTSADSDTANSSSLRTSSPQRGFAGGDGAGAGAVFAPPSSTVAAMPSNFDLSG